MISTLLAATHGSTTDLDGLVVCLLFAVIVGVFVFAILRAAGLAYAELIGLCVGGLIFLFCWT